MPLTLLTGGVRSGKSVLAVRLAQRWSELVHVIATGEPRDEEMAERIRRHRAERPSSWLTVEEPVALEDAIRRIPDGVAVIVDCLTLWVSNLIERGCSDTEIEAAATAAAAAIVARRTPSIAVTNEVGSGIVPISELGRRFADTLGRVNAIWAEAAERVLLVVAGRAVALQDPADLLEARVDG
jgi:adenosyl cobinamide kinase/adenosyl cobinamide phosphate guanylyltransferase